MYLGPEGPAPSFSHPEPVPNLACALPNHLPTTLIFLTRLPSLGLVMEDISEYTSDTSSLTEAPPSVMDIEEDLVSSPNSEISPMSGRFGRFGMSSSFVYDGCGDGVGHDESWNGSSVSPGTRRQRNVSPRTYFSDLEKLPVEASDFIIDSLCEPLALTDPQLLEKVAVYLADSDLYCLCLAGKELCVKLMPENSGIWKTRFLSLYDFPTIQGHYDFCSGYQLRRFVLRNFADCGNGGQKAEIGMEVLRDMVLGRSCPRHRPHVHLTKPTSPRLC